ncbi:YbaN family protein [Ruminococcaceae bacterium OttesenSCG-928-A16]|nr:YbaN family protein [Ruminococcaceae bacterium OttesenSCG-928-A16]
MKVVLLTALGLLSLALGIVGIFIPILPTTPFMLLATGCLGATPRLRKKIMEAPFLKDYFGRYRREKKLPAKTVVCSLVFLWGMLALSIIKVAVLWVDVLLVLVGLAVTVHILFMYIHQPPEI